jgi:hypothetical protein
MRTLPALRGSIAFALVAAMTTGCGSEPSPPDVTGTWALITSSTGGNFECSSQGSLTLQSDGAELGGTFVEEQAGCSELGSPISVVLSSYTVLGSVGGSFISFRLQPAEGQEGCAEFRFQGRITESELSGTLGTQPVFCQGTYIEITGTWIAQRR